MPLFTVTVKELILDILFLSSLILNFDLYTSFQSSLVLSGQLFFHFPFFIPKVLRNLIFIVILFFVAIAVAIAIAIAVAVANAVAVAIAVAVES